MKEIGCLVGVIQCAMVVEQIAWGAYVMILLLVSLFVSSCLTMFLLYAFLFLFLHALPYCLYMALCTVHLLMHSPAQSCTVMQSHYTVYKDRMDSSIL